MTLYSNVVAEFTDTLLRSLISIPDELRSNTAWVPPARCSKYTGCVPYRFVPRGMVIAARDHSVRVVLAGSSRKGSECSPSP